MAVTYAEPEVAKAVTTGAAPDVIHFSMPIEKSKDTATINPVDGTPDIEIWGKVTDGTLDSDLQIVDPDWSLEAIKTWYHSKGNIRLGHDPKRPVGRGLEIDGHYVKALIAEPIAKHLIRSRVLNDWSVGIMNPDIRKGDPRFRHLDPMGKAVNGVITGRSDGLTQLGEISVVDRGSNFGTAFQLVKAAGNGALEWTGALTAPDDVLAKYAVPSVAKDSGLTSVELPSDMKLKVTPAVLAKMATLKRNLVLAEQEMKAATPDVINKAAEFDDDPQPEFLAMKAAEAAVYKRDIDTATRRRLASENRALPNLSYPVETHEDADNAVTLILSGHGDVKAARRMVTRIARENGWQDILDRLKGKKASKAAAVPDVTKCMKCDGSGMFEDKPCPDCKAKTAEPDVAKKKGKMRAICPNCGAKQNPDHKHCPECGNALPVRALQVKKNHDFVCLHCGAELDKGEPHCPNCGKENPGYLPEADRKIPANEDADKSAGKDRVAKASKKSGKKGKPFGGNQAKPFGAEDEKGEPGKAEKGRKGKGGKRYGRNPAEGVTGHDTAGLPPHREPDGAPVEQFENDAHLQDGDQQMKAALRHKSLGIDPQLAVLHDLTCPAFSPDSVAKALPHASFAAIDTGYWQRAALDAAAGDKFESFEKTAAAYNEAQVLSRAALTLKTAEPLTMHRILLANHEAFLEANKDVLKTFRDATPGPGSAPTPGHVMPQSFQRPYISAGHAAESPQAEPARTFPVISDHPQAQDFQRQYLSDGHAAQSPDNSEPRSEPVPTGNAGMQESRGVTAGGIAERDYEQARSVMHDHLSRIAPGMCPMSPPMGSTQKPGRPVPAPAGMIEPHGAKATKADKAAARAAEKARRAKKAAKAAARKADAQRRKVQSQVLKGKLSVDEGRVKLGLEPFGMPETAQKAAFTATGPVPAETASPALVDTDAITAAVKAATAPLVRRVKAQDRVLRKNRKVLDAVANRADTSEAPFRGAGVYSANKASAAPAAPQTAAEAAALAQTGQLQRLHHEWRNSHIPEVRENAYREITSMLGVNPRTPDPGISNPFTN